MPGFGSGIAHAIAQGAAGYDAGQQDVEQKLLQQAALQRQINQQALQSANIVSEINDRTAQAQNRQEMRFKEGVRPGRAPSPDQVQSVDDVFNTAFATPITNAPSDVEAMRTADPSRMAPDRFRQVSPTAYVDQAMTPDAVKTRQEMAQEAARQAAQARQFQQQDKTQADRDAAAERRTQAQIDAAAGRQQWVANGVDPATGQPLILNTRTGESKVGGGVKPGATGARRREDAQLAVAQGQATSAHQIMNAYEDKVLAGQATLSPENVALAQQAANGGTMATYILNKRNPELLQYALAAKTISGAERMITPRGGSNQLSTTETLLSKAGTGATKEQIQQARNYRQQLIDGLSGHAGGAAPPNAPLPAPVSGTPAATPAAAPKRKNIFLDGEE